MDITNNKQITDISYFVKKHQTIILFLAGTIVFFVYGYISSPGRFYYDAQGYWYLRGTFLDEQGRFSFLNYNNDLRGYIFPFILFLIDKITPNKYISYAAMVALYNALMFSCIAFALVPSIIYKVTSINLNWYQRLFIAFAIYIFWRDYVYYPLSDFPAFFLLLLCLNCLFSVNFDRDSWLVLFLKSLFIGITVAAAYFTRPVYLISFSIIFTAVLVNIIFLIIQKLRRQATGLFLGFLIGVTALCIPQYMINVTNIHVNSLFISGDLFSKRLAIGVFDQKYETNLDTSVLSSAGVYFNDLQGMTIYAKEHEPNKISQIFGLFLRYPIDMVTIYFRHLFNGLNLTYTSTYVTNMFQLNLAIMFLNYTLIYISIFLVRFRHISFHPFKVFISTSVFILPVLAAATGAVEVRFFIPLHIMMYTVLAMFIGECIYHWAEVKGEIFCLRNMINYALFVVICFTLSGLIGSTIPGMLLNN